MPLMSAPAANALALPVMMERGYHVPLATGTIAASGTLGILIPPSIMLVFMADQIGLPAGELFMGAVFPGLLLASLYALYVLVYAFLRPTAAPIARDQRPLDWGMVRRVLLDAAPILLLVTIIVVLM